MANYGLVQSVVYQPFTYDEITKPLIQATQYHREVEKEYGDAIVEASHWRDVANQTDNPIAYQKYKDIMNRVNSLADALTKGGVTPTSSRDAFMVRADVKALDKNFTEAFDTYKEMMKFRSANPAYYMNTYNRSLDSFLGGKQPDNTRVTGEELTKAAAAKTQKLAESNADVVYDKLIGPGGYYMSFDQVMGLPADEFMKVIQRNPTSKLGQLYRQAFDDTAKQYGLQNYSESDQKKMWQDIYLGGYAGLQSHKYDIQRNPGKMDAGTAAQVGLGYARLAQEDRHHNDNMAYRAAALEAKNGGSKNQALIPHTIKIKSGGTTQEASPSKDSPVGLGVRIPSTNIQVYRDKKGGNIIAAAIKYRGQNITIAYNTRNNKYVLKPFGRDSVYGSSLFEAANQIKNNIIKTYKDKTGAWIFHPWNQTNDDIIKSETTAMQQFLQTLGDIVERNGNPDDIKSYGYYYNPQNTHDEFGFTIVPPKVDKTIYGSDIWVTGNTGSTSSDDEYIDVTDESDDIL